MLGGVRESGVMDALHLSQMRSPPPIEFSDEQKQAYAAALLEAHLAVLGAITREAQRTDAFDGPRNVLRLTQALGPLGMALGIGHFPPFFGMPGMGDDEDFDDLD